MSKRGWREIASTIGAVLIVIGLVALSVLAPAGPNALSADQSTVAEVEPQRERSQHPDENALLGDRLAPGLEAFTGIAALFVSIWAVWLVRETLVEARKATDAVVKANEGFAEFSQRELRAYLKAELVRWNIAVGEPLSVEVRFHNYGKTPAYGTVYICPIALTPDPYKWDDDPIHGVDGDPPSQVVHPGEEFFTNATLKDSGGKKLQLSANLFSQIRSGEWCVYVQCFIRYNDAFGTLRETDMRFEFSGEHCVRQKEFRKAMSGDHAS